MSIPPLQATPSFVTQATPNTMQRSMCDLPPELVLQIYTNLPTPSSIASLNRASHYIYDVWYRNAATISGKVLSRSLENYDTLLELRELDRLLNWGVSGRQESVADNLAFLAEAQKQAREHVAEARSKGYRGVSSSHVLLETVIGQNIYVIRCARKAARACILYERAASRGASTKTGTDSERLTDRGDMSAAYLGLWILGVLGCYNTMKERLEATDKKALDGMVAMTRFLVFECSIIGKYQSGVHRVFPLSPVPFDEAVKSMIGWLLRLAPSLLPAILSCQPRN